MIDSTSTRIFLFLAIISQLVQRALYFSIGEDISIQLHATTNFGKGKGITVNEVLANDLASPVSKLLSDWPIGYTLLLTPIYKVTNNIMWSAMILDLLFLALFIFLIYKVLNQIGVNDKALKVAIVFLALSSTPFIYTTRTGVLAICFLLMGIWHLLKIANDENVKWSSLVINGLLFTMPIWFRYSYMPFVAVTILFFGLKWLLTKEINFLKYALLSAVVVGISIFGINYFQTAIVGARNYLSESTGFGFYFSNLVYFKEFLFKGLFYVDPIIDAGNKHYILKWSFKILGLLFSTIVLIKLLVTTFKTRLEKNRNFEVISLITIFLNISMLLYLSLKYSNFHLTTYSWTFVQETRYFLPSIIVLIIFLFKNYDQNWIRKTLNVVVGFAGILFITGILRIFLTGATPNFHSNQHKDFEIIKTQLVDINEPIVFSTQSNEIALRNLIATEGYSIFNGDIIENLKENRFRSNSPITLITKFTKEDYLENQELLQSRGSQKLFENEQFILVKTKFPLG